MSKRNLNRKKRYLHKLKKRKLQRTWKEKRNLRERAKKLRRTEKDKQ